MAGNNRLVRYDPDDVASYPSEMDMKQVPLSALRLKSRGVLSRMLNRPKIIPTEEGFLRDWRGVANLVKLPPMEEAGISGHPDPIAMVIKIWTRREADQSGTFHQLLNILENIDRWDIVDEIKESLEEDAKNYLTNKHELALKTITTCTKPTATARCDANILTSDDVARSKQGLPPQQYDAFVLFADEDIDFATELIDRMEDCGFKLCVKERDLIGGVSFEHEAILRLISERCNRLIVIVSPAFLESSANNFFMNFAQALGIEKGKRKIVPCLYQRCDLPPTLNFYFLLNYQRSGRLWNFWEKLKDSIQETPFEIHERSQLVLPSITITEVDSSPSVTDSEILHFAENGDTATKTPRKRRDKTNSSSSQDTTITFSNENSISATEHPTNSFSQSYASDSPRPKLMPPPLKLRSSTSMVNLESTPTNSDLLRSNSTLNRSTNSVQSTKKMKWYKKFLSPSTVSSSEITKEKTKRKWFRRKLASYS